MRLAGMNQLVVAVKESLKTLTTDNHAEVKEKASSIKERYVDSVEFSDRAIELSMGVDTETDQGREEGPGTIQRQVSTLTKAIPLNVLA